MSDYIVMGRIAGLYGVAGWLKIFSYTSPRENIVQYDPWYLAQPDGEWLSCQVVDGRGHGKGVIAKLAGCDDRTAATELIGVEIGVQRHQLPQTDPGTYYWADLIGLRVETLQGEELGQVEELLETGANDVLVVRGERERLIPFAQGEVIKEIDQQARVIRVDWEADF